MPSSIDVPTTGTEKSLAALEGILERLQTDYVDLVLIHVRPVCLGRSHSAPETLGTEVRGPNRRGWDPSVTPVTFETTTALSRAVARDIQGRGI